MHSIERKLGIRGAKPMLWFLLVLGFPTPVAFAGSQISFTVGDSAFTQLTQFVAEADMQARQDFAWISISELIATYERVISESALERPDSSKERIKLTSWRSGAAAFSRDLQRLRERLRESVEVEVQPGGVGAAVIFIDGSPLVLSGPEIGAADRIETRILGDFCTMYLCPEFSTGNEAASPEVAPVGRGMWLLSNQRLPRYQTPDGLVFVFADLSARREKQETCEIIAGELRTLVGGLGASRRAGLAIDWQRLQVRPLKGAAGYHVTVNANGDYLRLELPYLSRHELLDLGGREWVKKRFDHQPAGVVFRNAGRFVAR